MQEVKIDMLGRQGDGVIQRDGRDQYVAYALPQETVEVSGKGARLDLERVVSPSPQRIKAACSHFTQCGGCQLQHLEHSAYQEWKLGLIDEALTREGIPNRVEELIDFPVSSRRRATFLACRIDSKLVVGFSKAASHEVIEITQCPVLDEILEESIESIRDFASSLPLGKKPVRIMATACEEGLDINVEDIRPPNDALKHGLTKKALELGFSRLSAGGEVLIEARKPYVSMGLAKVVPHPGAFLQASSTAETAMAEMVTGHLAKCNSVVDLYCGVGTFALRLAERSKVWALEETKEAVIAMDQAWRGTAGKLKELKSEVRNLERRPVTFQELKKFNGLVFDPPRAGAELQTRQIAKSRISRVAAVSCNPVTLARDLGTLLAGGYSIKTMAAFDQFRFTPHVEMVVLLEK